MNWFMASKFRLLTTSLCLSVALLLPAAIKPAEAAERRAQQIARAAEALRPKLIETRRDFHQHPELSNREERTARVVAERLRALGFDEVKTNVARPRTTVAVEAKGVLLSSLSAER